MLSIRVITPFERETYEDHLKRLDFNDRLMRFETSRSDESIEEYVRGIDLRRDAIIGAFDNELKMRGAAHVAFSSDFAELGLSVEPAFRYQGVGSQLMTRSIDWARMNGAKRFCAQCLFQNRFMMKKAKQLGFAIEHDMGIVNAEMELAPPTIPLTYKVISEENMGWVSYGAKFWFSLART